MSRGRVAPQYRALSNRTPLYATLICGAIVAAPLQMAFTLPEPFPIRLPTDVLALAALAAYVLRRRRPVAFGPTGGFRSAKVPTDGLLVGVLAVIVTVTAILASFLPPGSEALRAFSISPEFDLLWFTVRALLVLALWAVARHVQSKAMTRAFAISVVVMLVGVLLQQTLKMLGMDAALELMGYNTVTSGIVLTDSGQSFARSGTFPNGQELGFFAGATFFIMLRARQYVLATASAYCLVYALSTTGLLGVAAGLLLLAFASRSTRARMVVVLAAIAAAVAVASSSYLQAFAEFQLAKVGLATSTIAQAGQSLEVRGTKTTIGFEMMMTNPFIGVGTARFGNHAGENPLSGTVPSRTLVTVENAYAQVGAEHGVFALAVFALLIGYFAWKPWRLRLDYDAALGVFILVGIATQSMWTQMAIWLMLALISARVRESQQLATSERRTTGNASIGTLGKP